MIDLQIIEELGSLFYSIQEVSIMLNISIDEFFDNNSEIYRAYQKGFLDSEKELRKEIIETAKQGSPAAQEIAHKMIINSKTFNSRNG